MRLISTTLTRLTATLALAVALLVVPVAVVGLVGADGDALSAAASTGRLDTDAVVQLGLAVFVLLWAWFAVTAVSEVVRVLRWRRRPRTVHLRPTVGSPTGWVRALVRLALVSSSAVVPSLDGGPLPASRPAVAYADGRVGSFSGAAPVVSDEASALRSNGRETPYSIAVRLGDATLRDQIIELNRDRPQPGGGVWTGGVFPAGMMVEVPAGSLTPASVASWRPHTVTPGESVYRIAAAIAADGRMIRDIADQIIERNIGRTMPDGRLFDDPSLIRPGWVLEVPAIDGSDAATPVARSTTPSGVHVVERGDSYWSVAEQHAEVDDASAVAALTVTLIAANAPHLGHDDPVLLLPGDRLVVPPQSPEAVDAGAAVAPATTVAAGAAVPPAATAVPVGQVPLATPPTTLAAPPVGAVAPIAEPAQPPTTTPTTTTTATATTTTTTTTTTPATAPPAARPSAPINRTLGGAVLLCAGLLGLVEARRRHRLRGSTIESAVPEPAPAVADAERLLRSLDATDRALRLDLALRCAGHQLAGTGGFVRAAIMSSDGDMTVVLDRAGRVPGGVFRAGDRPDRWSLDGAVDVDELVATARLAGQPCPALVHVGSLVADGGAQAAGDVFVDLEAFGVMTIDGPEHETAAVLRAVAASLALSPVGEDLHVVTHGVDLGSLSAVRTETADDLDAALDAAAAVVGSTAVVAGGRRTFELRSRGVGGEVWEPVIVVSGGDPADRAVDDDLVKMTAGGRGLAVVLGRSLHDAPATLVAGPSGWCIRPLDLVVVPVGLSADALDAAAALVEAAGAPLPTVERHADPAPRSPLEPFTEQAWSLVVRVLGPLRVTDPFGRPVTFERGRSLELVAWLGLHRDRPTRSAARAAMWEIDVRDATFSNVVSEARRALARAVTPPEGAEWIGRTLTEQLPLHPLVVTDADLLRARLEASRGLPAEAAIEVLGPGVELIEGMPFCGSDLLWPDAEGSTSALVVLATGAAAELARHHLELGDIDGVFHATGKGLSVLGGHEELIALRMRAHAVRGNLAGVRHEWEFYERALDADRWGAAEPSSVLLSLRRELLSS